MSPDCPAAEELALLPHGELAERLAEAYRVIGSSREGAGADRAGSRRHRGNGRLAERVEALERKAGKDSSTSSKPPSSDSPYKKKPPRDRSLRERARSREAAGRAPANDEARG